MYGVSMGLTGAGMGLTGAGMGLTGALGAMIQKL